MTNTGFFTNFDKTHISVEGRLHLTFDVCCGDRIEPQDLDAHWKIQRADGEVELYNVLNGTRNFGSQNYPERVLSFAEYCLKLCCIFDMIVSPIDLRYDGAQITATADHPECYRNCIVSRSLTLIIYGKYGTQYLKSMVL